MANQIALGQKLGQPIRTIKRRGAVAVNKEIDAYIFEVLSTKKAKEDELDWNGIFSESKEELKARVLAGIVLYNLFMGCVTSSKELS